MGGKMTTPEDQDETDLTTDRTAATSWGPKLFWAVLIGVLVFFWWLLIYSHGVEVHQG